MADALARGRRFLTHDVWHIGLPGEEIPHGFIIKNIRVAILVIKGLIRDHLLVRASALTFTTMLALVPFLAIMFFMITTFNLGETIADIVSPGLRGAAQEAARTTADDKNLELWDSFLALLFGGFEEEGGAASSNGLYNPVQMMIEYAENSADPKALAPVGLLFVVATVLGMMMNIESSFNTIWGIKHNRSWYRMVSDYMMVLLVFPFMVAGGLSISAILESTTSVQRLGAFAPALRIAQILITWFAFSALYFLAPNTRVKVRYAVLSGVVAGTLWSLLSLAYVRFWFGLDYYNLLYSTFALVPILLMWVYFSWLIVLLGAEMAFAYQNEKTFAMERLAEGASYAYSEAAGVWAMIELGRRFDAGKPGLSIADAAEAWNVPTRILNNVLDSLEASGLVIASASAPPRYQPARSLDRITVKDVLTCLREDGRDPSSLRESKILGPLLKKLGDPSGFLSSCTISDLVRETAPVQETVPFPTPGSKEA